jgi:DnaK suppressor protein
MVSDREEQTTKGRTMDLDRAKQLLSAERERISGLLASSAQARAEDNDAERDAGDGDADGAQPLEHEALDIAISSSLMERLAAVERAEQRLVNGVYGLSVESGLPIPDDRLQADPAAELTVDEAAKYTHRHQKQPRGATGF